MTPYGSMTVRYMVNSDEWNAPTLALRSSWALAAAALEVDAHVDNNGDSGSLWMTRCLGTWWMREVVMLAAAPNGFASMTVTYPLVRSCPAGYTAFSSHHAKPA